MRKTLSTERRTVTSADMLITVESDLISNIKVWTKFHSFCNAGSRAFHVPGMLAVV